jgi:hypothetical protein
MLISKDAGGPAQRNPVPSVTEHRVANVQVLEEKVELFAGRASHGLDNQFARRGARDYGKRSK